MSGVGPQFLRRVLIVAWMSILLGFAMEGVLLLVAAGIQGGIVPPAPFVAELVQKVSWSFLVCVGLAFGTAVAKARPAFMGALGLLAAPFAFTAAKALHKGAAAALGLAAAGGPSALWVALVKALQYALLGWLLGRLSLRPRSRVGLYAVAGLASGLVFGGTTSLLIARAGASGASLVTKCINELLFPVGCSLVLYVSDALRQQPAGAPAP